MTSKRFCFTLNNPKADAHSILAEINCRYLIYGTEKAPTTGTVHFQGYVVFLTNKTVVGAKKVLPPGAHIEVAKGTTADNIKYCSKENNYVERGDAPASKSKVAEYSKDKWSAIIHDSREGNFDAIPEDVYFRYYNTVKTLARDHMKPPPPLQGCCGLWIHGAPGTGKSHVVATTYPDRFLKPLNKWWDGYNKHEVVHLDEVEPSMAPWISYYLKRWADMWPFPAETKGGALQIRPKKIIVTSNYTIEQMGFDEVTTHAVLRRFVQVEKTRDQSIII